MSPSPGEARRIMGDRIARENMPRAKPATKAGYCPGCRGNVRRGDPVVRRAGKSYHAHCLADELRRAA